MKNLAGVNFENDLTVKGGLEYSSLPPSIQDNLICEVSEVYCQPVGRRFFSYRNKSVFRIKFEN